MIKDGFRHIGIAASLALLILVVAAFGTSGSESSAGSATLEASFWGSTAGSATLAFDTTEVRQVQIIRADSLTGIIEGDVPVRRLIGNVELRQGQTNLRARRVTQYTTRNEILLEGNVRIVEEGDTLTADQVRYDTREKIGRARGNVRLADGEVVVRSPEGSYFTQEKRAIFTEGVELEDSASVLVSEEGEYFVDDKRAEFFGDVRLTSDRSFLEADSVIYFRETEVSDARSNVFIERFGDEEEEEAEPDTLRRTLLWGDRAYNDNRRRYSRVDGNAFMVRLQADTVGATPDTMLARGHRMEASRSDTLERVISVGDVEVWENDISAVADSVVYDRFFADGEVTRNESRLYQNPFSWFNSSQITGDTIRVKGTEEAIDSMFVQSNAFVAQYDTALARIHQLKGRQLEAAFENDQLRFMTVGPNAEVIRFLRNDEDELDGAVEGSSDFIDFWFEGDDLQRTNMRSGVEGVQYQADQVPDELRLDGYIWEPDLRPTRQRLLADERVRERLDLDPLPEEELEEPPVVATEQEDEEGG